MGKRWVTSLEDLRLFAAVYEEKSFTRAAVREMTTQSGVSQHVRKIERLFNIRLLIRKESTVVPTPAGHLFYQRCLDILKRVNATDQELRRFANAACDLDGEVTVGLMPTMTRCVLAPGLARFTETHPNVSLRVVEAYSAVLSEMVLTGRADFAIVPTTQSLVGLSVRHVMYTPEVLVSARSDAHTHLEHVKLADLVDVKLVVPGPSNARRATLESYFASSGVRVARYLELDAMMATLDLVARSDWKAILPGLMMCDEIDKQNFSLNPLCDPPLFTELVCITAAQRVLSPASEAFYRVLQEYAMSLNQRWSNVRGAPGMHPGEASRAGAQEDVL